MRRSRIIQHIAMTLAGIVAATTSSCASEAQIASAGKSLNHQGPDHTCVEDEPCFDCNTMGNGLCSRTDTTPFEVGE